MSAGTNQRKSLKDHVDRIAVLNAEIQDARWEIKEVADAAFGKGLISTDSAAEARKVVKQLAKDQARDTKERAKQRAYEELLDNCRASLGLLADTPLGEAAAQVAAQGASTNGAAPPKKRGRPPGSKNKPKAAADGEWVRPPSRAVDTDPPDVAERVEAPPVPDVPDLPPAA